VVVGEDGVGETVEGVVVSVRVEMGVVRVMVRFCGGAGGKWVVLPDEGGAVVRG